MSTFDYSQTPFDKEHAQKLLDTQLNPSWIEHRKQGGKQLSYIPGHIAIHLLNKAFNGTWSFEVVDTHVIGNAGEKGAFLVVKGRLEVPGLGVREQYGNQAFMGGIMDEHIFKGATTDAMKKCASMFGVALELYGDAEGLIEGYHNMPEEVVQTAPQTAVTPSTSAPTPAAAAKDDFSTPREDAAPAVAEKPQKDSPSIGWDKEDVENLKMYRTELGRLQGLTPEQSKDNALLNPYLQEFFEKADSTFNDISPQNIKDVTHFLRKKIDAIHDSQAQGVE